MTPDERLAEEAVTAWLGHGATREPLVAMNSSAWRVSSGGERYVLKISAPAEEAGLLVAAWLEEHGLRTGAPVRMAVHGGRLVALLRFVEGRRLDASSGADMEAIGETLGRAHSILAGAPVPDGLDRWPWTWLDAGAIDEPRLRAAAAGAIDVAERLAPDLTHGILHADAAPEAFLTSGDGVALIDWGAACHGPLLYDVARRGCTRTSASSPPTREPARSGPMSSVTRPASWPSAGRSRRGTSRNGSIAATSPGSTARPATPRGWRTRDGHSWASLADA
ncbi:MAG: hypothetical protein QOH61_621 [Chloroflexota bacterium]|jgi:Ser/Thr protein kinase RdoA (MazF antagonist)|nr:hypothetical protein [Chloroflexota bacterium]